MIDNMATNLHLDLTEPMDVRITEFKNDTAKVAQVNEFLNDVFEKAQKEAEQRQISDTKPKTMEPKKSGLGPIVLNHLPACLHPGSLPPYVTVPIQCGVLLLLATIILKKWGSWMHVKHS